MAELEYAVLADFVTLTDDGTLTVVGAHRGTFHVSQTPTEQVLCVGGRLFAARREPAALLSLGALTPDGEVPVVAQWPVDPERGALVEGRFAVCFAATLVAPVPVPGSYVLTLSVNGDAVRRLPFTVAVVGARRPS